MSQMGLDGRETPHPPRRPRPLSNVQREVLAYVRTCYPVRPVDVGQMVHAARGTVPKPRYYSSDGYAALRRLERRGLVVRERRGVWCPATHRETW